MKTIDDKFSKIFPDVHDHFKPRLTVGDRVRILKPKKLFEKAHTRTWSEVFRNILPNQLGYARGAFVNFSTDGQYMVVNSMLGVKKYNTQNFDLFQSEKLKINGYSAPMDKPSDYAITIKDDYLYFENLFSGDYVKTLHVRPK